MKGDRKGITCSSPSHHSKPSSYRIMPMTNSGGLTKAWIHGPAQCGFVNHCTEMQSILGGASNRKAGRQSTFSSVVRKLQA